ncbi:immunity 49 family protein [Streptomyces sp. NPDC057521]|uniref:immunity 49 family protein n=1 Tax=Streptomyces sp. NPDC057521 TaxID=3346156 RepID=UPI0036ABB9AF
MTTVITRHDLQGGADTEALANRLSERLIEEIDDLEESAALLDFTVGSSILGFRARCAIDPRASKVETWEATVNAMQVSSALFAASLVTEGTVECRINRKLRTIPAAGHMGTADTGKWLSAFWLALICRDEARLAQLSEIPLERMRSPQGQYDEYIYHWVDTLQTWWLRGPGLADKLIATIEASDLSMAQIAPRDLMDGILYPPINLFYHYLRRDQDGFAPALADALKLHRAYWTLNEDRATDVDGSIALGPLAIACLAHDADFPLDIESDYLPKHLLQRTWIGEFPT